MQLPGRRLICLATVGGALSLFTHHAASQVYPARPVRLVVPLSANSASDTLARLIADKLGARWGQPVTAENHPGAGTTVGTDIVAKAAPDGSTLLLTSASFAASAATYSKLPYEPTKDLIPVTQIASAPFLLIASPSGPKSVRELIETAKKAPGIITAATAGRGTSAHFGIELVKNMAGIDIKILHLNGPAEAVRDTAAGRVQVAILPFLVALPFVNDGRVNALGVTTSRRSTFLPNVPTVGEAGLKGFEAQDWWGVFAPAGTPPAIVEKISKDVAVVLELPEVRAELSKLGVEANPSAPEVFAAFVHQELALARKTAAAAGIKAE
jgi:tripartite-type tricarboxylate transporter receptor subunit TctC